MFYPVYSPQIITGDFYAFVLKVEASTQFLEFSSRVVFDAPLARGNHDVLIPARELTQ